MNFTVIFSNNLFASIFGFLGAMGFYDWCYFRFMPKTIQKQIDAFFCKLPNIFKSHIIRNTYIKLLNKINTIVNNKSIKKWELKNKELYNNTLYCISTLICLIPGFISFFKNRNFIILGPFYLGAQIFIQSTIFFKTKEIFTKRNFALLVFFAGGNYSMLSSIGFIFFKNETIGVGYCAACLTTFLFGLYIYIFMKSIIRTKIFIHKCSYGQSSTSLVKNNISFFIVSIVICSFTLFIIWVISKLISFVNLTGYHDIKIIYEANRNYLFTSVIVYGLFISLQVLIIVVFLVYLLISFCLYICYLFTKIIAFKKIYLILICIALAYYSGIILYKIYLKNQNIDTNITLKVQNTSIKENIHSNLLDELDDNTKNNVDSSQSTEKEKKDYFESNLEHVLSEKNESSNKNETIDDEPMINNSLEEEIPMEALVIPPLNEE